MTPSVILTAGRGKKRRSPAETRVMAVTTIDIDTLRPGLDRNRQRLRVGGHRKSFQATQQEARPPADGRPGSREPQLRTSPQQRPKRHLRFQTRQESTEAVVYAIAEGQVTVGIPPDVQKIRPLEFRFIAIGRAKTNEDALSLGNRNTTDGYVDARPSRIRIVDRTVVSGELLDRERNQRLVRT